MIEPPHPPDSSGAPSGRAPAAGERTAPTVDSTGGRPWAERIGLAAVATVMALLFAAVAFAAGSNGEWILAAMSGVGAFMTVAVGLATLIRG